MQSLTCLPNSPDINPIVHSWDATDGTEVPAHKNPKALLSGATVQHLNLLVVQEGQVQYSSGRFNVLMLCLISVYTPWLHFSENSMSSIYIQSVACPSLAFDWAFRWSRSSLRIICLNSVLISLRSSYQNCTIFPNPFRSEQGDSQTPPVPFESIGLVPGNTTRDGIECSPWRIRQQINTQHP